MKIAVIGLYHWNLYSTNHHNQFLFAQKNQEVKKPLQRTLIWRQQFSSIFQILRLLEWGPICVKRDYVSTKLTQYFWLIFRGNAKG